MVEKDVTDLFLEDLKKGNITKQNKERFINIVKNFNDDCTELQKKRFMMFYNLIPEQKENYTITNLGRKENCTYGAVKSSIASFKRKLFRKIKMPEKGKLLSIINETREGRY